MKMKTLLAGAAVAALTAGAAQAQTAINLWAVDVAGPGAFTSDAVVSTANVMYAQEGSIANVPANFEILLASAGATDFGTAVGGSGEALIQVDLTGAVFDRSLGNDDIIGTGGSCSNASMTVDTGGAAGNTSVTFRVANIANCDTGGATEGAALAADSNIVFALPLRLNGGNADFNVTIRRAADNVSVASGSYQARGGDDAFTPFLGLTPPLVGTGPAVTFAFSGADDALTGASPFTTLADGTLVGAFNAVFTGALAPDNTAVAAGDVSTFRQTVTFGSTSGLDMRTTATGGGMTLDGDPVIASSGNTLTFNRAGADIGAGPDDLVLATSATPAAIQVQANLAASAEVTYTGPSGLTGTTSGSGNIGSILRPGITTQTFEWVGQDGQATRNVFRVTGIAGPSAPGITANLTNSNSLPDASAQLSGVVNNNGEAIITQTHLTNALGNFGRGDISFTFQLGADPGIQVRRLMVGANGTLTDFGNENVDTGGADITAQGGDN